MKAKILLLMLVIASGPYQVGAYTAQTITVSSSHSGGVSVVSGESTETGSTHSSSEIHTTITSGTHGGSADTTIITENDGVRSVETRRQEIRPGESATILVATSSGRIREVAPARAKTAGGSPVGLSVETSSTTATSSQPATVRAEESWFARWVHQFALSSSTAKEGDEPAGPRGFVRSILAFFRIF